MEDKCENPVFNGLERDLHGNIGQNGGLKRSGRQEGNESCGRGVLRSGELFQLVLRSDARAAARIVDWYPSNIYYLILSSESPGIRADILSASSRSHIEAMQVAISPLFAAGQAYVALNRVRSLDGIRIEELDCSKLTGNTLCNSEALNEIMRLRNDS
ncbi:hypothetical protein J6590_086917 [Homalodisca vitripennis]|nr:hypothetical protein J6590_086917 [Homalodisca vitripennis]